MILTKKFGFKKRELTDGPPDITATEGNWDLNEKILETCLESIENQGKQINDLKKSVSEGKSKIATALRDKGVIISGSDSFNTIIEGVHQIPSCKTISGILQLSSCNLVIDEEVNMIYRYITNDQYATFSYTPGDFLAAIIQIEANSYGQEARTIILNYGEGYQKQDYRFNYEGNYDTFANVSMRFRLDQNGTIYIAKVDEAFSGNTSKNLQLIFKTTLVHTPYFKNDYEESASSVS